MGAYWFRRVIEGIQSMPSVDQVLVKQLVKKLNAESYSAGVERFSEEDVYGYMPATSYNNEVVRAAAFA